MKDSVVSNSVDEFSSVLAGLDKQASILAASQSASVASPDAQSGQKITSLPSYQPYRWAFLNSVLDYVDENTNGRAGWLQRLVSYLFFGGTAALVNLAIFYIMYYHVLAPLAVNNDTLADVISYIIAAECSIIANFIPNDRYTFNKLAGASRPWLQRCLRFHMTTIVGTILTFVIQLSLSNFTPIPRIFAEAIAILLVLIYNFTFHHIFTYRHAKHA
ncbi:MAG TPA: GtrA family protein [Ktedonobacteraceae bacterium]